LLSVRAGCGMRFVSVFSSGIIAFLGLAGAAQAGDRWTGFYGGIHIGHAWGDFSNDDLGTPAPRWWGVSKYGSDTDQLFGGVQAGYNLTFGSFVVGIEGEFGVGLLDGSATDTAVSPGKDSDPITSIDSDYYGAVTGRAGVIVGSALIYGKGGWATVETDINWSDAHYTSSASASKSLDGAVYGGGIEFALAPGLSVKAEYLHFDIGDSAILNPVFGGTTYPQFIEIDDVDTVKIGVNVKLGD